MKSESIIKRILSADYSKVRSSLCLAQGRQGRPHPLSTILSGNSWAARPTDRKKPAGALADFSYYPEIITHPGEEQELLHFLIDAFLYKKMSLLEDVTKPVLFEILLKALALQISLEVSFNDLSRLTGVNHQTVEKNVTLLEKVFVVFSSSSFCQKCSYRNQKGKNTFVTMVS